MIDAEHSPFTMEQATELVHTIIATSQGHCLPIIRIPSQGTEYIKWGLDSGAAGIIIPMVHNPEDVKNILANALYPPDGSRSFGPYSGPFGDLRTGSFADYYAKAQRREIGIFPTIESREGLENVEEILSIKGVSGLFIGPYDLRLSLGLIGGADGDELEFKEAIDRIFEAGKKYGKPVGCPGKGEVLSRKRAEQGAAFLLVSFDYSALNDAYRSDLEGARNGVSRASSSARM